MKIDETRPVTIHGKNFDTNYDMIGLEQVNAAAQEFSNILKKRVTDRGYCNQFAIEADDFDYDIPLSSSFFANAVPSDEITKADSNSDGFLSRNEFEKFASGGGTIKVLSGNTLDISFVL